MAIPAASTCGKEQMQCINPAGQLWPADFPGGDTDHCFDCQLVCPGETAPASTVFCNTGVTAITMWMTGFQFTNQRNGPCVALLFPEWALNSRVKFAFGCIGTFLIGVTVGLLSRTRSNLLSKNATLSKNDATLFKTVGPRWEVRLKVATVLVLFAIQMTLAYWLMLIAMTYQAELFIMVVLGLTTGHALFQIQVVEENIDPCCAC